MDDAKNQMGGLLWAMTFADGRGGHLDQPQLHGDSGDRWTWAHFPLADVRSNAVIAAIPDLPDDAKALIAANEDRVQIHAQDGWTFGVLPDLERDLAGKPTGPGRLVFALTSGRLITARLHALRVIGDVRLAAERRLELHTPAQLVVAHVERFMAMIDARSETLMGRLDSLEDLVLGTSGEAQGQKLGPLRRELARHRRELQWLRSAFVRHRRARTGDMLDAELDNLISQTDDLDRDLGGLQERARLLHEEIDTLITGATNRAMRTLTVISTLLIPPTLVVGAFGMNVPGIPFAHSGAGFALACVACLVLVGGLVLFLKRLGLWGAG